MFKQILAFYHCVMHNVYLGTIAVFHRWNGIMIWYVSNLERCLGSVTQRSAVNLEAVSTLWVPALHLEFCMWPRAEPRLTESLFNFSPCWSDYSNGYPWDAVIRLLVVVEPVATWMPITITTSPTPTQLDSTQQVPSVAAPIRLPHLIPQAEKLLCYATRRW